MQEIQQLKKVGGTQNDRLLWGKQEKYGLSKSNASSSLTLRKKIENKWIPITENVWGPVYALPSFGDLSFMSLIAVDMTPVLPGGKNGGSKILALELLKSFQNMAPEHQFVLLTASWNHDELAILDGSSMSRICVLTDEEPQPKPLTLTVRYAGRLQRGIRKIYRYLRGIMKTDHYPEGLLTARGVDLLFCPFTAPTYAEPGIPVVSIIYDLQHLDSPQFFHPQEIDHRNTFLCDMCKSADSIICISQHVRRTVLKLLDVTPERTFAVPICIQKRLAKLDPERVKRDLADLGIGQHPYMFYPANFWPHKNHRMLLTAYGMFLSCNPDNNIELVFTGALEEMQEELDGAVRQMRLSGRIHFLGFLPEDQLAAVWQGCDFLIFPSLYEGFGIPVLEAMSLGKPVLCSNSTSLPEVAGNAALYFDPHKPKEIVRCMERIIADSSLRDELINLGCQQAAGFRKEDMAHKYLEIFRSSMNKPMRIINGVSGVFEDGWTGKDIVVTYGPGSDSRELEMRLEAPLWIPARKIKIKLLSSSDGKLRKWKIHRGKQISIRLPLGEKKGNLTFCITPTFRPSDYGLGEDKRALGLICHKCKMMSLNKKIVSLFKGGM